ncbi:Cardiolipin synthase [Sphingobacterium spiritivorum]|uniref:Cardiolipin synthase n=1 Tax=Sphingobacterium spiritivorum TaxID=258 RepID=A0A380BP62_SPHSI|nr:cardiolipin synthase [Sphingobacterium spiritivorum]SUJ04622.1 Cardiolipin synthase [Sphingobacterium spiritivorum]
MEVLAIESHHVNMVWEFLVQWYWIPLSILYIGVISTILIENRNPSKTVSWVMVIVFLPVIGLILYYLFGQKFQKIRKFQRMSQQQAELLEREWNKLEPEMERDLETIEEWIGSAHRVFTFLKNERLSSPSLRNRVTLLTNGEEKFPAFLKAIRGARHAIHVEYYIFELDNIGLEVLNALEEKAAEGVKVRLIVDSFGSPDLVKYLIASKKSKIEFQPFLPVTFTSLANSNYRNHRKIAVIDGHIGFVGGINISDRYINYPGQSNAVFWRDTSVMIEGEAVNMLQVNFWMSWNQTDGEPFMITREYLCSKPFQFPEQAAVAFTSSDPGSVGPFNMEAILLAISEAKNRVQLCTPYYIPSDELSTALQVAAASGVEVELMMPAQSDSYFVQHASFSFLKSLLNRGVKVYLYTKGFIHAKTLCIDGKVAFIGTTNLDIRSFYINFEISAIISDLQLCVNLENQFEKDKTDSDLLTLKIWKNRSKWKKGVDSLCRLLAPLL